MYQATGLSTEQLGRDNTRDWVSVQHRTFTAWVNQALANRTLHISNLEDGLQSGVNLVVLVEELSGRKLYQKYAENPRSKFEKLQNCSAAIKFVEMQGIKLVAIGPEDMVEPKLKLILGLVWTLILRYHIQKTGRSANAKNDLLEWVRSCCKPYNIPVQNFTNSFADGRVLCALVDSIAPGSIDVGKLDPADRLGNATLGIAKATAVLGIPEMMEPGDFAEMEPEELSTMTYVSYFRNAHEIVVKLTGAGEGLKSAIVGKIAEFTLTDESKKLDIVKKEKIAIIFTVKESTSTVIKYELIESSTHYVVKYTPTVAGTYTIKITYDGQDIPSSPFTATVTGGGAGAGTGAGSADIDAGKTEADGEGLVKATVGQVARFRILPKTSSGSRVVNIADNVSLSKFVVTITYISTKKQITAKIEGIDEDAGSIGISYVPEFEGDAEITILYAGKAVAKSPYNPVTVSRAAGVYTSADWELFGEGLKSALLNQKAEIGFRLISSLAASASSVSTNSSQWTVRFSIAGKEASSSVVSYEVTSSAIFYTIKAAGTYVGHVYFDNQEVARGSPFEVTVANDWEVFGEGLKSAVLNQKAEIGFRSLSGSTAATSAAQWAVKFTVGGKEASSSVVSYDVTSSAIFYTIKAAGTYTGRVYFDGEEVSKGSPFEVTVADAWEVFGEGLKSAVLNQKAEIGFRSLSGSTAATSAAQWTVKFTVGGQEASSSAVSYDVASSAIFYTIKAAGTYTGRVYFDGEEVSKGSPFEITVADAVDDDEDDDEAELLRSIAEKRKAREALEKELADVEEWEVSDYANKSASGSADYAAVAVIGSSYWVQFALSSASTAVGASLSKDNVEVRYSTSSSDSASSGTRVTDYSVAEASGKSGDYQVTFAVPELLGAYFVRFLVNKSEAKGSPLNLFGVLDSTRIRVEDGGNFSKSRIGESNTFTLTTLDSDNVPVSVGELSESNFSIVLKDSSDAEISRDISQISLKSRRNGIYAGTYSIPSAGRYTLSIGLANAFDAATGAIVRNQPLSGSPYTITSVGGAASPSESEAPRSAPSTGAGAASPSESEAPRSAPSTGAGSGAGTGTLVDPSKSVAFGEGARFPIEGRRVEFTVQARDAEGKNLHTSVGDVKVEVTGPSGARSESVRTSVTDLRNGQYTANYRTSKEGKYNLSVRINDTEICGFPKVVETKKDNLKVSPEKSVVKNWPATLGVEGVGEFDVEVRDRRGNLVGAGDDVISLLRYKKGGKRSEGYGVTGLQVTDNGDGTYHVVLTGLATSYFGTGLFAFTSADLLGDFAVDVEINGEPISAGPFALSVVEGSESSRGLGAGAAGAGAGAAGAGAGAGASGAGAASGADIPNVKDLVSADRKADLQASSGMEVSFQLTMNDHTGKGIVGAASKFTIVVLPVGGSAQAGDLTYNIVEVGDGVYSILFTATASYAADYVLYILFDGNPVRADGFLLRSVGTSTSSSSSLSTSSSRSVGGGHKVIRRATIHFPVRGASGDVSRDLSGEVVGPDGKAIAGIRFEHVEGDIYALIFEVTSSELDIEEGQIFIITIRYSGSIVFSETLDPFVQLVSSTTTSVSGSGSGSESESSTRSIMSGESSAAGSAVSKSATASASKSRAGAAKGAVFTKWCCGIQLVGEDGSPKTTDDAEDTVVVDIDGPDSTLKATVQNQGEGKHHISFTPLVSGKHTVHIYVNEDEINGSPFTLST